MEEREYFMITTNLGRFLVLAEDSIDAINLWNDFRKKQAEEGESFFEAVPQLLTVERIAHETQLIQASE